LLVWVYYSAQIFLLGAEFTWVYATERKERAAGAPGVASAAAPLDALALPPSELIAPRRHG